MSNEEVILENKSNSVIARTVRIANFLTFLSFQAYVNPDLSKLEVKERDDMLKLKKGFDSTFNHYVTLHQPNQDYSIAFVNHVNLCKGWFDLKETYEIYLKDYCTLDVSVEQGERFQDMINMLDEKKINIFEVAGITNRKAAATTINAYKRLYLTKSKKPKKFKHTLKWKMVNYMLAVVAFIVLTYLFLPSFFV